MYRTFTRTFWRENPAWPNGLEPCAGPRHYHDDYDTMEEAREACREWNAEHDPGRLSRKMEFEEA